MKAVAVFPDRHSLELIDVPEPRVTAPGDVKIRVLEVGICGTDREICTFEYGELPPGSPYLIIGHETLGEVVEVGSAVQRPTVGDLVVPTVRRPCPHPECRACRSGNQDFCTTGDFTERGIKGAHGFMTEYVVDDARYMNPVPRALRPVAVLVEPLTIAAKALRQLWQVELRLPWLDSTRPWTERGRGVHALVLGAGPVGLLGAMSFRAAGCDTYVYSREQPTDPKAMLVSAIGANYICAEVDPVDGLPARLDGIDVVYEAVGASGLAFAVMPVMTTNAVFIFTGVPGNTGPIEVDADRLMRDLVLKNQVIYGTVNAGPAAFELAINGLGHMLSLWPEAVRGLLTGRFPIERYRDVLIGRPGGIKNLIDLEASA
jgi:threonine dehydrogenase-like Zn-dependent dehydrogenase